MTANDTSKALIIPLRQNNRAKTTTEPFDTFAAAGLHHGFLMRNNGSHGDGGEHCTDPTEWMRTLTTAGHQSLVQFMLVDYNGPARTPLDALPTQTTVEGEALASVELVVEDCLFRMLEPHEIQRGMAFAADYVLLGNKREKVRLAGNAVTPPAARVLGAAVVEALLGEVAA